MLSLVIPCHNESDRFTLLQKGILDFDDVWPDNYEVVLVNDGSTDDTLVKMKALESIKLKKGQYVLVDLVTNLNKGGALKEGVAKSKGDFILTLDADMSTSPSELINWKSIVNKTFDKNTIYIGSRSHNSTQLNAQSSRKQLGGVFNSFVNFITPLDQGDTQCGFKLYPRRVAKDLFYKLEDYGWAHDVEILVRAHYQNISIVQLPISWSHVDGSKINVIRDGIKMAIQVFRISRRLKNEYRHNRPAH